MNAILENMTGMSSLTDQVVTYDLLMGNKAAIKTYAAALTETTTPEIRAMLSKQLTQLQQSHEQITAYMVSKGWYHPFQVKDQIQLQLQMAKTALALG
jgi:similar to spore coat protein